MMTFRRHLRQQVKLSGRKPDDLLVQTGLSVFRNRAEWEKFLADADISDDDRFEALNAIATLRSKSNSSYAEFTPALASFFKLTNLVEADRLSRISYSTKYSHYLDIRERDIAFDGYEWAAAEDIAAVFSLTIRGIPAEYIRDLALYEIEEGVNDTHGLLDATIAYERGVPAGLWRRLRGHVALEDIIEVYGAAVPERFAEAALLSGATAEQTITAHQESIPLEYVSAL